MTFTLHAPQIIWFVFNAFVIIAGVLMHGKPREGKYNVMPGLIVIGLEFCLLYWGGFFSHSP